MTGTGRSRLIWVVASLLSRWDTWMSGRNKGGTSGRQQPREGAGDSRSGRGGCYARAQEDGLGCAGVASGKVSSNASTAQPVDRKLMNCDLPPGSPLSKKVCTGRLRV